MRDATHETEFRSDEPRKSLEEKKLGMTFFKCASSK